jgi:hypothetical protein
MDWAECIPATIRSRGRAGDSSRGGRRFEDPREAGEGGGGREGGEAIAVGAIIEERGDDDRRRPCDGGDWRRRAVATTRNNNTGRRQREGTGVDGPPREMCSHMDASPSGRWHIAHVYGLVCGKVDRRMVGEH